jgi:cell shape-determining protein MreC
MLLSALSAFVLPIRLGHGLLSSHLQNIFAPVAAPMRYAAFSLHRHYFPDAPDRDGPGGKPRSDDDLRKENQLLRQSVTSLTAQLDALKQINADRDLLGRARELCTPFAVMGADSSNRESLNIQGTTLDGLRNDMPVLYPGGIAGQIEAAGVGGARVRLITDKNFATSGSFARFHKNASGAVEFVRIALSPRLLEGAGNNTMLIRTVTLREKAEAGLDIGDLVILNDDFKWPANLQGYHLGRVTNIGTRRDAPLFAEIEVTPLGNLKQLREVMVMTKK